MDKPSQYGTFNATVVYLYNDESLNYYDVGHTTACKIKNHLGYKVQNDESLVQRNVKVLGS
jgi:hypothetical protein